MIIIINSKIFPLELLADECTPGYTIQIGDIPGWGSGGLGGEFNLTREECAKKCTETLKCLSFEHSISENKCNLNDESNPDVSIGAYKDYAFCTKTGNAFPLTVHVMYMMMFVV